MILVEPTQSVHSLYSDDCIIKNNVHTTGLAIVRVVVSTRAVEYNNKTKWYKKLNKLSLYEYVWWEGFTRLSDTADLIAVNL